MKKEDWKKLCKHIYEKNCILVLGSEFPIELTGENKATTFAELLTNKVKEDLRSIKRLPDEVLNQIDNKDLSQLTVDYLNYKGVDKRISREDLECSLTDYLAEIIPNTESQYFQRLLSLPFTLIVNTNYTRSFHNQLIKSAKTPVSAYFNFRCNNPEFPNTAITDLHGTELSPLIYNLFGCTENSGSLVISDSDLLEFAINVISKNPGLPVDLRRELENPQKIFLFMGLNFMTKSWYIRMLLQALGSNNKEKMSYAVESADHITNYNDPTTLLFRDELKVSLHHFRQEDFIDSLINHYNQHFGGQQTSPPLEDMPKAFISYKSEDYEKVNEICQRLKQRGVNAWLDKDRLNGRWESAIANEISKSDAFILMHSHNLSRNPVNYVNVEIKEALDRARYYGSISDFIFPALINTNVAINTEQRQISQINFYDLTKANKIDELAMDIRRSHERNRRKPAA